MKFFSIVLIVFFVLAVTNSYSIITVTIHPDVTWTGGDWGVSKCGSYTHHSMITIDGVDRGINVDCEQSNDMCFNADQHGQDIVITMYNLVSEGGGGSGTGEYNYYKISSDSSGKMTIENLIYPYGH